MDYLAQAESLLKQRNLSEAAREFQQAEHGALIPDRIDAGLWHVHMLAGDFEQAWQASDRIRARNSADPNRFWTGESILGRDIVVRSLHGLGDAVQMFRYAPQLKALANSVTWQVPPNLVLLARRFNAVEHVITWDQPCKWDLQMEITELPYVFRTTLSQLPIAVRYLKLPSHPVTQSRLRIGLVWAAGEWNQSRSIPLARLEPLMNATECDLISLQGGPNPEYDPRLQTIKPGLLTLARTIAGLHLVVTVDTLAAHLGGALNVPTFVLLEYAADWRWLVERDDSPWYPSLRLFRQPEPGDWDTPVQAICKALDSLNP